MKFETGKRYLSNSGKQYVYAGQHTIYDQTVTAEKTSTPLNWGIVKHEGYSEKEIRQKATIITPSNPLYLDVKISKRKKDVFFGTCYNKNGELVIDFSKVYEGDKATRLKRKLTGVALPSNFTEKDFEAFFNRSSMFSLVNPEPIILKKEPGASRLKGNSENVGFVLKDNSPIAVRYTINVDHKTDSINFKMTFNGIEVNYISNEELLKQYKFVRETINPRHIWVPCYSDLDTCLNNEIAFRLSCYIYHKLTETYPEIIFKYGTVNQPREIVDGCEKEYVALSTLTMFNYY